ncbi:MAG: winged helix-turn-helix domain-containing protein [Spirochaetota bacterium]
MLKFFINPNTMGYLRELAAQMNESTNAVRIELDKLVEAGYLDRNNNGNKVYYKANTKHSLFSEIHALVKKYVGIDVIIDELISRLGDITEAYIIGDYAKGVDSGLIDVVLIGKVEYPFFLGLVQKAESIINRKIRYIVLTNKEKKQFEKVLNLANGLLVWGKK